MCGIVGVVLKTTTGFTKNTEDIFSQLVFANTLRGDDSTGIIAVEKDTTFHVMKEASPGYWFMPQYDTSPIEKAMWSHGKALIGHNRKKTIGSVSDDTAHPFVENDDFAMVHNGTLFGHRQLADTEVDSQALTKVLSEAFHKEDYKESLEETLGRVNGAYAVAMYDQRHNKVRLLRNKERPLSIVETNNAFFFASEGGMLFWILSRNGIDFKDLKVELVPEHTVFDICLDTNTIEKTEITPKKPKPPVTTHTQMHTGGSTKTSTVSGIKFTKKVKEEGLSKNAFKKFRNKMLGKRVDWWCEDFIETNFPKTEDDGETLFTITGVSDSLAEDHLIRAEVDIKELAFAKGKNVCDRLWSGTIVGLVYERRAKKMIIQVEDCKPVPVSLPKMNKGVIPKPETYDSVVATTNKYGEPCKKYFKNNVLIAELTFAELYGEEKETKSTLH